jgi:formylglycine-generating enzyme required for sulfatase activity
MVRVAGQYCPDVAQPCLRWLDDPKLPFARCAVYARPSRCLATRQTLRFCIDRYEYTPPAAQLPLNFSSFAKAAALCTQLGKRVCTEQEWNFACEGEAMQPYPYGFERRPVCNQDRYDLYEHGRQRTTLRDLREPSTARPACVSPFGVFNMAGNLDEPVRRHDGAAPFDNALKGGWWMPSQNRCRFATTAHDDFYQGIQVGVRCCSSLPPAANP